MPAFVCSVCSLDPKVRKKIEHLIGVFTYEECETISKTFGWGITGSSLNRHKTSGHITVEGADVEGTVDRFFTRWLASKGSDYIPTDTEMRQLLTIRLKAQSKKKEDKDREKRLAGLFGGLAHPME
jgi:hypothetical protein